MEKWDDKQMYERGKNMDGKYIPLIIPRLKEIPNYQIESVESSIIQSKWTFKDALEEIALIEHHFESEIERVKIKYQHVIKSMIPMEPLPGKMSGFAIEIK